VQVQKDSNKLAALMQQDMKDDMNDNKM